MKTVIAIQKNWNRGRKESAIITYSRFLELLGGKWSPPKYIREEKIPFIQLERELDDLIAGCSQCMHVM